MSSSIELDRIDDFFPSHFTGEERSRAKTLFFKNLSLALHDFYNGKMQTIPKCAIEGQGWFNAWYTPGVSKISTVIRDDNDSSFALSNRGNLVAIVSDSTRVLGDGDCTPAGGLGVMEGKALLMKYLGGVDATALCVDSRDKDGKNDPEKLIEFVKMCQHSFGAVNLEDISQPNCFRVLDELRESCDIPVWHDDAQGTACVILAGLVNALKLAGKTLGRVRIVSLGAGAANVATARLIMEAGGDPGKIALFDVNGGLHAGRSDIENDPRAYRQWELCLKTNPQRIAAVEEAVKNADVLIALSAPGPDTVKRAWVRSMADKAIVFACANPMPEIWPHAAKEEGAFIVATGRGDFPNQVNNAICFPGILKGALLVRSRKITDAMVIRCSRSIAEFSEQRGISPDNIIATMDETELFARESADVAETAIKEGVARVTLSRDEAYRRAKTGIEAARRVAKHLQEMEDIVKPPKVLVEKALKEAIQEISERQRL
ncbi:MAG: NADP-dependent malic enzyme [Treponema sp.]|jgi:malate dehydrogenase (oxaloacetate-decarboxylating)|nr:NADP-dependent malic enzyme [Treponema sp.]